MSFQHAYKFTRYSSLFMSIRNNIHKFYNIRFNFFVNLCSYSLGVNLLKVLKNRQTLLKMFRKFLNPAILSNEHIINLFKLR